MSEQREIFSSRWALILASLGMAIGAGNIWRFPRIAAENGGGSFLIPWIVFLFLWSIPLIIAEYAMGRKSRKGVIGSFIAIMGPKFAWMGAFVAFCTMGIMFYYSVVTGWSIRYFYTSLTSGLAGLDHAAEWSRYTSSGYGPVFFHLVAMSLGGFVIHRGVKGGIEKVNKVVVPLLFLLLIIAAARALTLPGATEGLNYLFSVDFEKLKDYRVWLEALSQSAWSTGAGWGLLMTYAIYMDKKEDIVLNSFIAGFGNNAASLLAGLAVIPTVFALSASASVAMDSLGAGNTGLTFIVIPQLFEKMPGGAIFETLFFLALSLAAFSSLLAMIELSTRIFMDMGMNRKKAIKVVGVTGFLLGIPSAIWLGFFNNQDWVWGIGLMVSGLFVALAVIKYGADKFREELVNVEGNDIQAGRWFSIIIKWLIPIEFTVMLGWWFWRSATEFDPDAIWNPFHTYNIGTTLLQWGVVITFFIVFNKMLVKMTSNGESQDGA